MSIVIINPETKLALHELNGNLVDDAGNVFPNKNGVFRFVRGDNYTGSFGYQWNRFPKTQVDRFQNTSNQSHQRFFAVTGWDKHDLTNQNILEVGSGAGRFTEVVLGHTNANLFSVDYSDAVDANFANNGPHPRLKLFQASIYELPFAPAQFDKVFCFGVLQHTPDVKKSVECLAKMVKPGGELIVDFYPVKGWYTYIHAKYLFRPFLKKMDHQKLLALIERNANWLIGASRFFNRIGLSFINRFLPVCDIKNTLPPGLDGQTLREWVILDTFDMYSPAYDQPQKLETVVRWFKALNLVDVKGEVVRFANNTVTVVKGKK